MSDKKKIYLLNLLDALPESVEGFLNYFEVENLNGNEEFDKADVIIVKNLQSLEENEIDSTKLYLVEELNGKNYSGKKINVVHFDLIELPLVQKLTMRYLEDDTSIHAEKAFNEGVKHFESFKITDYHQVGYYCDVASMVSQREGFNFISIKLYLTYIMTFFSYLKQANHIRLPIDFDLAGDDKTFMVQAHCSAEDFQIESLKNAFEKESIDNPSQGLILGSSTYSHFLDFYYLEKSSRLVITALWIDLEGKSLNASQGLLFKIFKQFSGNKGKSVLSSPKAVISKPEIKVNENDKLPGEGFPDSSQSKSVIEDESFSLKPVMAGDLNRIVTYIKGKNSEEENPYPNNAFDSEVLNYFLQSYPFQDIIKRLQPKNLEYIINSIRNENYLNDLIGKVKQEDTGKIAENVAQAIQENFKDESLVESINKKREELGKEKIDVANVANEISNQIRQGKDQFKDALDIQEQASTMVTMSLELPQEETDDLLNNIMKESVQNYIDALEKAPAGDKVDKAVVVKMMKAIQVLKKKIVSLEENKQASSNGDTEAVIKNKDKVISELLLKVDDMKEKLDKQGMSTDDYQNEEGEVSQLKHKIGMLESQLDLYKERVSVLSEKIDKNGDKGDQLFNSNDSGSSPASPEVRKLTNELRLSEDKMATLQKNYEKLKEQMKSIEVYNEREVSLLKDQIDELQKNKSASSIGDSDNKILDLKRDNKKLSDELKGIELLYKKQQAKIRHSQKMLTQYQEQISKLSSQKNSSKSNKAIESKFALKIKQLETFNEKIQVKANTYEKDLQKRKAENAKLKQELGTLRNQLAEAERKLGKKAA